MSTLFHNARVLTMDLARPRASAVAIRDGRIVVAGDEREAARALDGDAERIDCAGGTLLPAFIDAHCHLLSYAASLRSVDCRDARSIADVQLAIGDRAASTPADRWIRAFGYDETSLAERRHPDRNDLDAAAPDHPVRLIHGSGHASVLNSRALREANVTSATEEPPGGVMERDLTSGEPTGVLFEMERLIDAAVPPMSNDELASAVRDASQRMLRAGIVCLQDATHSNGRREWETFERLLSDGALAQEVVLMEGLEHMGELPERGADGRLRRGPVKIVLHEFEDEFTPGADELRRRVAEVHDAGRQVAIHAVGEQAVAAAAAAIEAALRDRPRPDRRHRIEHCGLLPERLAPRLAQLGVVVVSQPSFLRERGERYRQLVPVARQGALYAFRTLRDAGVALAASSDAPVSAPEPLASAAAAAERLTVAGRPLAPEQMVKVEDALRWWTAGAAYAAFLEDERGALRPGARADLVLLPASALDTPPDQLRRTSVTRVWREGMEVDVG